MTPPKFLRITFSGDWDITYCGFTGIFPPPPGASTTKVGTAKPEVWPLNISIISIPADTLVLKCSMSSERSHWYR